MPKSQKSKTVSHWLLFLPQPLALIFTSIQNGNTASRNPEKITYYKRIKIQKNKLYKEEKCLPDTIETSNKPQGKLV